MGILVHSLLWVMQDLNIINRSIETLQSTLNPKPLNPKTLNPKTLNPKPYSLKYRYSGSFGLFSHVLFGLLSPKRGCVSLESWDSGAFFFFFKCSGRPFSEAPPPRGLHQVRQQGLGNWGFRV